MAILSKKYNKSPLTIPDQINLLESRGLVFEDKEKALQHLKFISYYRLRSYALIFEENKHHYKAGSTFEQVLDCYIFDRKLRLLVIDAIERIEVAVRTIMTNELALRYGAHWYMENDLFLPKLNHNNFLQNIRNEIFHQSKTKQKKRETFIQNYYQNYSNPELPPIWMIAEILSLGTWSMLFAHLIDRENQKVICKPFGISYIVMTSWLLSLSYLRNLCAHHSRLWNRHFTLTPITAKEYIKQLSPNTSFSAQAAILRIFMRIISPDSSWNRNLWDLINAHPEINQASMGFCEGWYKDKFWGI